MAGGYRCSSGHTWLPPDGSAVAACPVCGDTAVFACDPTEQERPVFVVADAARARAGGQDLTLAHTPGEAAVDQSAPTVTFSAPPASDTPGPSSASLLTLAPPPNGSNGSGGSVVQFGPTQSGTPPEVAEFIPPLVPGYEILHEVGRGGMGVVYKARQVSLNRSVALKMILSGSHAGPKERERFRREAEAVAALQHAHIVQIFEIGEANGHPYLALEFVEGGSLAQRLGGGPWPADRAAALVEVLARAMQFAHDAGIVHRDLKPGNILLQVESRKVESRKAEAGDAEADFTTLRLDDLRPKVTDFGLAKRLDDTVNLDGATRTGAVMGTPSYIAPEQASGKTHDIGPAADVYALGAILYELLTGRPPFRGETPLDTVLQVLHDDPVPPKRLQPDVPRDLETICLKCLSKSPAARYPGAAALADDLRRFLGGEPIDARPLGAWGRTAKWARRHPALAALLSVTAAAMLTLVAVLATAYVQVRDAKSQREHEALVAQRERDRAEGERKRAADLAAENERRRKKAVDQAEELKREAERSRRAAYALQLSQVAILCERDPRRAAALLDDEARCPPDLRDFTWHYLRRLCQRDDRAYLDHQPDDPLRAAAYSPAGTFVATAGDAGQVRVWDPRTGRTWAILSGHVGPVLGLAFSPDGGVIASAGADRSVRLWVLPVDILETARRTMTLLPWLQPIVKPAVLTPEVTLADAHADEASCVAFGPDGRTLASGGKDGYLRWWTLSGWRPANTDTAVLGGAGAAAASLAHAARSPDARAVWATREVVAHPGGVHCVSFFRNGRMLASGGQDRTAVVWAADGSSVVRTLSHGDAVRAVAASPDGRTLATVNNGQSPTVRLFSTDSWRDRRLFGHTETIYALAFSDDGQLLASAGFDKTVRLWDVDDGRERGVLVGHTQQVNAVAFAPDRRTVVSAGMDGAAVVWQTSVRTHESEDLLRYPRGLSEKFVPQALTAVGVGGGGTTFLAADDVGRVRGLTADFAPANRAGATAGPLTLVPLPFATPPRAPFRAAAASADGRTFVAATDHGLVVWRILQLSSRPTQLGRPPTVPFTRPVALHTPRPVRAMAIDPSGRWLATVDPDGVRVHDLRALPLTADHPVEVRGTELRTAVRGAREVAFHPTRDWLAVTYGTGVRIVTLQGKVLADLPKAHGAKATVDAVAFDKSGRLLATGDASGLIKLWMLGDGGELAFRADLPGHTGAVYALGFSPDGRTLASAGDDRAVILWDPVAARERLSLAGHADRVLKLVFNPEGTALVTVGRDGAVKRWRADVRPASDPSPRLPQSLPGG